MLGNSGCKAGTVCNLKLRSLKKTESSHIKIVDKDEFKSSYKPINNLISDEMCICLQMTTVFE
jgi:hypothetical protein